MKFLKKYNYFLNEGFDLNYFYKKDHIPQLVQDEATSKVTQWTESVKKIPIDVNLSKLTFWYAKVMTNYLIENETINLNALFKTNKESDEHAERIAREDGGWEPNSLSNSENTDRKLLNQSRNLFNFLKGKPYNPEDINQTRLNSMVNNFKRETIRYETTIIDYIFSSIRNTNIWKINYMSSLKDMFDMADKWHKELKASGSVTSEEGEVILEFNNGFYWIDLQTNDCSEEADAMGHCGRTSADTILSLRQKKNDGSIEPFVTIAIDYIKGIPTTYDGGVGGYIVDYSEINSNDKIYGEIFQCKGKNNKKPIEKYHKYIVDLYVKYEIGDKLGREYQPDEDFEITDLKDENLINKIFDEAPKLINLDDIIFYDNELFTKILFNKSHYTDTALSTKMISNRYYLMDKMNLITKEEYVSDYPNILSLREDKIYLKIEGSSYSDFDFMYEEEDRKTIENIESDFSMYDRNTKFKDLYLHDLTEEAEKIIEEKIEELKKKMDTIELAEFDDYDTWQQQVEHIDSLDDLKSAIVNSYDTAQDMADQGAEFEGTFKPLYDFLGIEQILSYTDKDKSGFLFPLDKNWLIRYDKYNDHSYRYKDMGTHILEDYFSKKGDNEEIEPGEEYFKIDTPYYGWNGDINKDDLTEEIRYRVGEIK